MNWTEMLTRNKYHLKHVIAILIFSVTETTESWTDLRLYEICYFPRAVKMSEILVDILRATKKATASARATKTQ